jgi:hypothetical protein
MHKYDSVCKMGITMACEAPGIDFDGTKIGITRVTGSRGGEVRACKSVTNALKKADATWQARQASSQKFLSSFEDWRMKTEDLVLYN